jgi:hypothetical protein
MGKIIKAGGSMEPEAVSKISRIKADIGSIIITNPPLNTYEFEVHGILTSIYLKLDTIKLDKLGQIPLPEPKKPEGKQISLDQAPIQNQAPSIPMVDCPTCFATKCVKDGEGHDAICPTCDGKGSITKAAADKLATEKTDKPKPAAVVTEPIILEQGMLKVILDINSNQTLREKPPRVLGMFDIPNQEIVAGKLFVCTGTVWSAENKDVATLVYEAVPADKYTGIPVTVASEESFTGVKFTYKEKDYVLSGNEYQLREEVNGNTEGSTAPPIKGGRKSNAEKKTRRKAAVETKSE